MMAATGLVSIVGAGPGDPGLLTRAALARLRRADLVLFDALVSPETLALARRARRFSVGKRAGRPSMRQETIHALMIRAARRGQRVVRLKGGDPFVFGRGGEEALALGAAGVAFEVIPGVSAAISAPALAGIPVTHRGVASAFTVVSGHAASAYEPVLDGMRPGAATLVLLMAVATQDAIAASLVARGWPPATNAALIFAASRGDGETWTGTLAELAAGDGPHHTDRPGTLVVGEVVKLRSALAEAAGFQGSRVPEFQGSRVLGF
ncbi:MAG TPA: uroporphyrinogen-III C-methyltransferase [Vicinamibacterales bacterium]|nr:uroporphyrinogen-III C-methyltransferase [Vicinamibacterales bacterium]